MISLSKKNDCILNTVIIAGTILFFIVRILLSTGEIQPDSIQYFLQAQDFWDYKVNFPLGYSFLIKIVYYFTGSYIISSKLINLLSYLFILLFSYKKKFFFSETVLVFSFYPFVNLYPISLSESVYYLFNYLIIYTIYRIIETGFRKKYTFISFVLFFILVSVRFSGIFVFATSALFLLYCVYRKGYSFNAFFQYITASAAGIVCYLFVNYLYCGFLFGQRDHLHVSQPSFLNFISTFVISVARDFSFLNIFIHKGISEALSFMNIGMGIVTGIAALFIIIRKKKELSTFSIYLFISFLGILMSIAYTYYVTKVDDTIRVKSNAYLYLIFFLAINFSGTALNFFRFFLVIALGINSGTLIKHSDRITVTVKKYNTLICPGNNRTMNIIYKPAPEGNSEHSDARILLFKSLLIDKNYKIYESQGISDDEAGCNVRTSQIIE